MQGRAVWALALGQTLTYATLYYCFAALLPHLEQAITGLQYGAAADRDAAARKRTDAFWTPLAIAHDDLDLGWIAAQGLRSKLCIGCCMALALSGCATGNTHMTIFKPVHPSRLPALTAGLDIEGCSNSDPLAPLAPLVLMVSL